MTMICDLSQDLIEEILSRVPITCRKKVRCTCKGWNFLFNDQSFTKKHCAKAAEELMAIVRYDSRAYLMSVNLQNRKHLVEPSIEETGIFSSDIDEICGVCDGLIICIVMDNTNKGLKLWIEVWNPYIGQVRCIEIPDIPGCLPHIPGLAGLNWYAFGYDENNSHKILRICYDYDHIYDDFRVMHQKVDYEIYSFKSNSWKVLRDTFDWYLEHYSLGGVSLKGNTYFIAYDRSEVLNRKSLFCFDFTRERFGPHLHLPFHPSSKDSLLVSTVREEQLAVLFQRNGTNKIEIWITTKIESDVLSWITFLQVDMKPPIGGFSFQDGIFLVDDKKKTAVICFIHNSRGRDNKAYMIGEDGYYKVEDLRKSACWPQGCPYVPSLVQIH